MQLPIVDSCQRAADDASRPARTCRAARLAGATLAVAVLWLAVLPWLAGNPQIASQLRWLDEQKIDPSAMYYTELEAMKPILQRLNERERNAKGRSSGRPAGDPVH